MDSEDHFMNEGEGPGVLYIEGDGSEEDGEHIHQPRPHSHTRIRRKVQQETAQLIAHNLSQEIAAQGKKLLWITLASQVAMLAVMLAFMYYQGVALHAGSGAGHKASVLSECAVPASTAVPFARLAASASLSTSVPSSFTHRDIPPVLANRTYNTYKDRYSKRIALGPSWAINFERDLSVPQSTYKMLSLVTQEPADRYPPYDPKWLFPPALWPETCFRFRGDRGHVGASFATFVFIQDVGVNQPERKRVLEPNAAPMEMRVWGVVEGKENKEKRKKHCAMVECRRDKGLLSAEELEDEAAVPPDVPVKDDLVLLLRFEYDRNAPNFKQDFHIPNRSINHNMSFRRVIFEVTSNWGNPYFTTLYGLRVHGIPQYIPRSSVGGAFIRTWAHAFSTFRGGVMRLLVRPFPPSSHLLHL